MDSKVKDVSSSHVFSFPGFSVSFLNLTQNLQSLRIPVCLTASVTFSKLQSLSPRPYTHTRVIDHTLWNLGPSLWEEVSPCPENAMLVKKVA